MKYAVRDRHHQWVPVDFVMKDEGDLVPGNEYDVLPRTTKLAVAGGHLYRVEDKYSDADGNDIYLQSVVFVALR